mgnify:CR=1 FL=1
MKRHLLLQAAGAALLVAGTWIVATHTDEPAALPTPLPAVEPVALDPTESLDELTLRTGDGFWGLHLQGIVPCAKMLVRGGGHIVSFSLLDEPLRHSHFHVRGEKTVVYGGHTFRISVIDDDMIHVVRQEETQLAAAD